MSLWHEIVASTSAPSNEVRTSMRCLEVRDYDIQRGAWVAYERCSDIGRVVVYVYLKRLV